MNIKNNIINYLKDEDYVISIFNKNIYIYKYDELVRLSDNSIIIKVNNKIITINGSMLKVVKMTKDEFMISGEITKIGIGDINEKD